MPFFSTSGGPEASAEDDSVVTTSENISHTAELGSSASKSHSSGSVVNMAQFFKGGPISTCRINERRNSGQQKSELSQLAGKLPISASEDSRVHDMNGNGGPLTDVAPAKSPKKTGLKDPQIMDSAEGENMEDLDIVPESPQGTVQLSIILGQSSVCLQFCKLLTVG